MVLVDTSVWVSHLREGNSDLADLLNVGEVVCHRFVVGEIACGNLRNRAEIMSLLQALPMCIVAEHEEVLEFIDNGGLMGKGLGYIDVHLLASAVLTDTPLWTLDKQLKQAANALNISHEHERR